MDEWMDGWKMDDRRMGEHPPEVVVFVALVVKRNHIHHEGVTVTWVVTWEMT